MKTLSKPSVSDVAKMFGCSEEQVKTQFSKNAAHLSSVISKLETGKTVNGYKPKDIPALLAAVENYETKANA